MLEVTLTEQGKNLREKAVDIPAQIGRCVNLTKEEAQTLYGLLYKIMQG